MAYSANNIQLGREIEVYAVLEPEGSEGTLTYPATDGTDAETGVPAALYVASSPNFNQQPSFTDSEEIANTRSLTDRFVDQAPAGSWDFNVYARMNSVTATKPDAHNLYLAALGGYEYMNPGTHSPGSLAVHKYYPAMTLRTMTIFFKQNDMVFAASGATVNEMKASLTNKGAITWAFSGGFMRLRWCGKVDAGTGASGTGQTLTLKTAGDYRYFSPGMKFQIYDGSASGYVANSGANGGTVFTIKTVNSGDNTLTLDDDDTVTFTGADGDSDYIMPYLPTSNKSGTSEILEARDGSLYFDEIGVNILSSDITITNNIKYQEDEITTDDYPVSFIADRRSVSANSSLYFRRQTLQYFQKGYDRETIEFQMLGVPPAGTAANAMLIHMPKLLGGVPALSGDLERQLAIDFVATSDASKASGAYYPDPTPAETGKENEMFLFFGDITSLEDSI